MTPLLLALLVLAQVPAADVAFEAKATPSTTDVSLGEPFKVEVTALGPPGTTFAFPDTSGNEEVDLRTDSGSPGSSSPSPLAHSYVATAFALKDVALPPIAVHYRTKDGGEGEVKTEAVPLHVLSVLPKDTAGEKLKDIRGPLGVRIGGAFWIALLGLLAVLGLLVVLLLRRRRRDAPASPAAVEVEPGAEAREALDALSSSDLLARGEFKGFYIALTNIAKRYLERRLQAPVLEMTSSEMVVFLREHPTGKGLVPLAKDLAASADFVKFAKGSAVLEEASRHLLGVRQMVDATEAALEKTPQGERVA